jgi:hypothetical protein
VSRQSQGITTLALTDPRTGEVRNLGEWDQFGGGGVDSDDNVYRASGGRRVSLGAQIDPDTVTLGRLYELTRDHADVGWLLAGVGIYRASITKLATDVGYAVVGSPLNYVGTLKRVTPPELDSDSDDPAMIELEFTVEGPPKQG